MQILLTSEEADAILVALKQARLEHFWVIPKITGKIQAGKELQVKRANCEHEERTYIGLQQDCAKCGGVWKIGQGESWSLLPKDKKTRKVVLDAVKKIGLVEVETTEQRADKEASQIGLIGEEVKNK